MGPLLPPDGPSVLADGPDKGMTLRAWLDKAGKEALGTACEPFEDFPMLIKLIDAKKDLSIQVHPSDAYALEHEGQYGKTEMWVVLDAEPGASLYYGFDREVSLEEFSSRVSDGTLTEVLRKVPVKPGDVFFIPSGTLHAIGAGLVIAEIQQNSNVTYRVYDYGRKGTDGKERDLHIEKALQVTNRIPILKRKSFEPHIVSCEYFTVDKIVLDGQFVKRIFGETDRTSFASLLVLEGEGEVCAAEERVAFRKGDSVLITADTGAYELEGNFEALLTTV